VSSFACPFCGAAHTAGTYVCPTTNRRLQGLLPVGTVIDGKFRIDGIIGVGGMGVVYRAEQTNIARKLAIKMLLPEYIVYPDLVARVQREARTAGQIEHPNVVTIVDLGSTPEQGPYIAMELLRGAELATVVEKAGGNLDPAEAVDIMRQVLAGLEAAHKCGVIHRDLKPENIFLASLDDGSRVVKVLDFGISKLRDDSQLNSLTRTGTVMGTPQFMAPEQAAGARGQDVRIDLYACGAVLYAILCNGLPFEAENYNLLISEILNKPPIPILARDPTLDPRLAAVVMKAIAKKPEQRYQTARAMSDALAQWYDNRNSPIERVHTVPAPAARGRVSDAAIQVVGARQSVNPKLGAGAREAPRLPPQQALARGDGPLSPDDPDYLDPSEATVVVPTVLPDGLVEDDFDDLEPVAPPPPPRGSRPSAPRPPEARSSEAPPLSVLIESPLDAPPLVLPERPKPPPTEHSWAQLSPSNAPPPRDPLDDSTLTRRRPPLWPYVLLVLAVGAVGAAVAINRFAPETWLAMARAVGLADDPPPPPPPNNVRLIDPDGGAHDPAVSRDAAPGDIAAILASDHPVDAVDSAAAASDRPPAALPDSAPDPPPDAASGVGPGPAADPARRHRRRRDH
jgi:serine/threonine protein kinase